MIDCVLWHSDWKCIDEYVYGFTANTKSVTFYTNSLTMRGFWMKKKVRFDYDNGLQIYELTCNAQGSNRAASTRSGAAATPTLRWICAAIRSDSWRHGWWKAERKFQK